MTGTGLKCECALFSLVVFQNLCCNCYVNGLESRRSPYGTARLTGLLRRLTLASWCAKGNSQVDATIRRCRDFRIRNVNDGVVVTLSEGWADVTCMKVGKTLICNILSSQWSEQHQWAHALHRNHLPFWLSHRGKAHDLGER